jgi:hypothetical protein
VQSDNKEDKSYKKLMDTVLGAGHRREEGLEFEEVSAEKELDVLLNSFSSTHLSGTNLNEPVGHNSTMQSMKISESDEKVASTISSKLAFGHFPVLSKWRVHWIKYDFLTNIEIQSQHEFKRIKKIDVTTSIDDSVDELLEVKTTPQVAVPLILVHQM